MKYILSVLSLFLFSFSSLLAYDLYVTEVSKPYEIVPLVGDIEKRQVYLGSLENFPVMYEVSLHENTTITTSLRQLYRDGSDPLPLTLLMVKQNEHNGGVTEIARFTPGKEGWRKLKDKSIGLTLWNSEEKVWELEPGIYRIEISTPNNTGQYFLNFGDYSQPLSYFENLSRARSIQKYLGFSLLRMVTLPAIYYPIGIFFLLFLITKTRKYFKMI